MATQWLSLCGFPVPSHIFVAVSLSILIGNPGTRSPLSKESTLGSNYQWLGSWKGVPVGNLTGVCAGSSVTKCLIFLKLADRIWIYNCYQDGC